MSWNKGGSQGDEHNKPDDPGVTFRGLPVNHPGALACVQSPEAQSAVEGATHHTASHQPQTRYCVFVAHQCGHAFTCVRPHLTCFWW